MTAILILGGTEFVGRAIADVAIARGHEVTLLNRGTRAAPEGARQITADRRDARMLEQALREAAGTWDAALDTWSWEPFVVRDTARLLESRVHRSLYVSTRSVYAHPLPPGAGETHPLVEGSADDGDPARGGGSSEIAYPRLKAGAEKAVIEAFGPDRSYIVRPGLVLGPHENVGRLPWWLTRIARGGEVLAPGDPASGIQYIDARDLAGWMLDLATGTAPAGCYDAVSPAGLHTLGELLEACVRATGSDARLRWMTEQRILAAGIEPWTELPIWLPQGPDHEAMHESDTTKAVRAGIRLRPLAQTVDDTWAWLTSIGGRAPQRLDRPALGLAPERERELLR
ncbi:NAD-dependent epimerase/dehydratase family protein [Herbiconiux sp.]|uniref:NAD-dependent epimerase/dehydratase family protein n=1 Tax=Herbiconiux sp. TaxID=1871186 RepID=UPI0025C5ECFB|nr:NAD-dependent epimerase/dehydratase family protein [Herbiconiux sp.]